MCRPRKLKKREPALVTAWTAAIPRIPLARGAGAAPDGDRLGLGQNAVHVLATAALGLPAGNHLRLYEILSPLGSHPIWYGDGQWVHYEDRADGRDIVRTPAAVGSAGVASPAMARRSPRA